MKPAASPGAASLKITNTLGGRKEEFRTLEPGRARLYHCGPTVTGPASVDRFRSYLLGDLLRRHLEASGLQVTQVMNITDVGHLNEFDEDAIEITAGRSGLFPLEFVEEEEKRFHADRRAVHILDAHHYPRAREHVKEMVTFVEGLLAAGLAYREGGHVWFDTSRAASLGRLSGKSRAELESFLASGSAPAPSSAPAAAAAPGAAKGRRHLLDFDLWRSDPHHQMNWPSPWGRGFPGWHVECVVMGRKYLGNTFDLHSGALENIFPHHECEIAQAEAAGGGPLARYWIHSHPVLLEGKLISRANRNLITVHGLLEDGVSGPSIRGALLSRPYREPIDFSPDLLEEAEGAIDELRKCRDHHRRQESKQPAPPATEKLRARLDNARAAFRSALDDDLDSPRALRTARELAREFPPSAAAIAEIASAIDDFDRVLGLL